MTINTRFLTNILIIAFRVIVTTGALGPILKAAQVRNQDLQLQCAGVLANLAENIENQISIVEAGGTGPLVLLGGVQNQEVQQGIANICL